MKKAFTISEAIIAATMLGVIAAVVLPMINDFQPNKDKTAYNKALHSMQNAVSNVMENTFEIAANMASQGKEYVPEDYLQNLSKQQACELFAENFNTSGAINCGIPGEYGNPNFTTTDGMKFWRIGGSGQFAQTTIAGEDEPVNSQIIFMDRDLKKVDYNKRKKDGGFGEGSEGLKLVIRKDGKVYTPEVAKNDNYWAYENKLIEKSMSMNLKE